MSRAAITTEAEPSLPGYRLERLLGEGGMGQVWQATRLADETAVAVKLLRNDEPRARERLLREARSAQAVDHPHAVDVLAVLETEDGAPALVMELLEGETLADRLSRDKPLPTETVAELLLPVVSAVGRAHAKGLVHRDLKPSNVFLTDERVKVVDFGIAKQLSGEGEDTQLTGSGSLIGTPCYMAPEQAFGEKDIDDRADVWAIGIILYEALSGLLPTKADNVGQVLKVILTRRIWPLSDAAPDVPEDVAELVDRMLTRERDARPSLTEVAEVLGRYTDVEVLGFGASTVRRAVSSDAADEEGERSDDAEHALGVAAQEEPIRQDRPSSPAPRRLGAPLTAAMAIVLVGLGWRATRPEPTVLEPAGIRVAVRALLTAPPDDAAPLAPDEGSEARVSEAGEPAPPSPSTQVVEPPPPPAPAATPPTLLPEPAPTAEFDPLRERR
jgi:serine/threonine-protein kinase